MICYFIKYLSVSKNKKLLVHSWIKIFYIYIYIFFNKSNFTIAYHKLYHRETNDTNINLSTKTIIKRKRIVYLPNKLAEFLSYDSRTPHRIDITFFQARGPVSLRDTLGLEIARLENNLRQNSRCASPSVLMRNMIVI